MDRCIQIALDDFGAGYSSLAYRRSFDKIKIDRPFVQAHAGDQRVWVILEAILGLCQNLGLERIGEGIKAREQLDVLRDRGSTEVEVGDFVRGNVRSVGAPPALQWPRAGLAGVMSASIADPPPFHH